MTRAEAKLQRRLNGQESVRRPIVRAFSKCWAVVKKAGTGSGYSRAFGTYGNCERDSRSGCLTCGTHKDREADARALSETTP